MQRFPDAVDAESTRSLEPPGCREIRSKSHREKERGKTGDHQSEEPLRPMFRSSPAGVCSISILVHRCRSLELISKLRFSVILSATYAPKPGYHMAMRDIDRRTFLLSTGRWLVVAGLAPALSGCGRALRWSESRAAPRMTKGPADVHQQSSTAAPPRPPRHRLDHHIRRDTTTARSTGPRLAVIKATP